MKYSSLNCGKVQCGSLICGEVQCGGLICGEVQCGGLICGEGWVLPGDKITAFFLSPLFFLSSDVGKAIMK